ncbi:MAG: class I adenylate-forming enzyme family protein [Solirubrobacteraceae bacterium]
MSLGEAATLGAGRGDLGSPIRRAAVLFGSSEAFVDGDLTRTYTQLAERVAALGGALDQLHVALGARVGFLGVNSATHAECWFGVPGAGRVLVDLNFRLVPAELEFIVNDCEIQMLIVDAERMAVARELLQRCASLTELVLDGAHGSGEELPTYEELLSDAVVEPQAWPEDQLAGICYTGGTTGSPKGVMLSHGNLLSNARHNLIATGHTHEDRWLHVPPMFHVAGTSNLFACTWAGSRQSMLHHFEPREFIDTVRRESITHCSLVPTMLSMLMDELARDQSGTGLPSLRHVQYAASPITPALQRRVLEYLDCDVVQFYGMTEAAPTVTQLSAVDHRLGAGGEEPYAKRLGSVGIPVIGVEVAVLDPEGMPLPPGQVGELCVRGPNVMLGYWSREDATAAALADGWYHSGDAVWQDDEGYLFLVDRLKDMIITGGENVYSIEVEAALAEHPAVSEVAVIGVPDPHWGEAVHAVVSILPGQQVSAEELIEHSRKLIAGYKVPRSIDLRTEPLSKSGPGKILKGELRQPYWAGHSRRVN